MNPLEFIKNLRRADDATKKRWLVILSAIAMLIVLVVWAKYFAASLVHPNVEPAEGQGFSFWETMGTGLKVIGRGALSVLRRVGGWFGASQNYIIQPSP